MNLRKILLNLFSIFDKSFWFLEDENHHKKGLVEFAKSIYPIDEKITLSTITTLNKGWYLYGIKYFGNNKFVIGNIYLNKSEFNQGRPMNSGKYRWRIIRISSKKHLKLILNNIRKK